MKQKPVISNPAEVPVQAFLSEALAVGEVLAGVLEHTGPASIIVSTYSTGEEFLRYLLRLRQKGRVRHAVLVADFKAAEKTVRMGTLSRHVFDEIRLCQNHSKVMLVRGERQDVCVLTSQNQTRGHRMENYCILTDKRTFRALEEVLLNLQTATIWNSGTSNG